jgi:hypothetical protein
VGESSLAIQYIKNPPESVQMKAVRKSYYAITFIKHPTEKVQLAALRKSINALEYINNPSPFVKTLGQVMKNEHITRHQLLQFVEEAHEKSKEYPFLLEILKERGWA